MSTKEVWDRIYGNLGNFNFIDLVFYERLAKILVEAIEGSTSILEVGSGSGFLASFFQNRGLLSIGIDRSIMPARVAKEKFKVENIVLGDMFHIPFNSSSFDVVWNEGVLEHFSYPNNLYACKEMARVSKNLVIIAVPNRYTVWTLRKTILKLVGKWAYGYEESYSTQKLRSVMEKAGLEVLWVKGIRILPPIKERKKLSDVFALGALTLPLRKSTMEKIAKWSLGFEERHELLTRIFGYEIIAVGRKK